MKVSSRSMHNDIRGSLNMYAVCYGVGALPVSHRVQLLIGCLSNY